MGPAWVLPHGLQCGKCPSLLNMEQGLAVWFVWGLHGAHSAGEAAQRSGPACASGSVVPSPLVLMEGGMTFPGCGYAVGLRVVWTPLIPGQLCFPLPSVATSQSPLRNASWQELAHTVPWHQPQGSCGDSSSSVAMGD